MRIGIDCRIYGAALGNVGRYTADLLEYLIKNDMENEYVLFCNRPFFDVFEVPNNRCTKVLLNAKPGSWKEQFTFPWLIRRARTDVMHFTDFRTPLFYSGPSIVTIHDLTLTFYPGKRLKSSLDRRIYKTMLRSATKKAKNIIAVSESVKSDILETLNVPEEKIITIWNGVPAHSSRDLTEEIAKFKELQTIRNQYLLTAGEWQEHKNLVRLIHTYADLAEEGIEVDLVIAGKEDTAYHEVRDTIIERNLSKQVHIL